jgi:hypothetical protein
LLAVLTLHAQNPSGEIRVQVKDPSGASDGSFRKIGERRPRSVQRAVFKPTRRARCTFEGLPYGRYRLQISKPGFVTQSVQIDVRRRTPISRTVTMALSSQAAKVDVVSETPLAGTDLQINQIAAPVQTATAATSRTAARSISPIS